MPALPDALPDWQRAYGNPLFQGLIKNSCSDFEVTEVLGFTPLGDGEHDYLWIEKEDANTAWVAAGIAKYAGVPERDVGFAGRKDRKAVTRQWFSVRRLAGNGTDWAGVSLAGVSILDVKKHNRKLKRGAHRGNRFRICVRDVPADEAAIVTRLEKIRNGGVPNYFGEQRFGRDAGNVGLARSLFSGTRMNRNRRNLALSAARAFLFNEILHARVVDECWDIALPGEALNLDGTGSIFIADEIDDDTLRRLRELDIHPTAAMWGSGDVKCSGRAAQYDKDAAARHGELASGLEEAGLRQARRATRLAVRDLAWKFGDGEMLLDFSLMRGSYATSVLRELLA